MSSLIKHRKVVNGSYQHNSLQAIHYMGEKFVKVSDRFMQLERQHGCLNRSSHLAPHTHNTAVTNDRVRPCASLPYKSTASKLFTPRQQPVTTPRIADDSEFLRDDRAVSSTGEGSALRPGTCWVTLPPGSPGEAGSHETPAVWVGRDTC